MVFGSGQFSTATDLGAAGMNGTLGHLLAYRQTVTSAEDTGIGFGRETATAEVGGESGPEPQVRPDDR